MEQTLQIWAVQKSYGWIVQGRLLSEPDRVYEADAVHEIVQETLYRNPGLYEPGSKLIIEFVSEPERK